MAPHSRILAMRMPWTEEPDRLQSMGVTKSLIPLKQLSTWVGVGRAAALFPPTPHEMTSCRPGLPKAERGHSQPVIPCNSGRNSRTRVQRRVSTYLSTIPTVYSGNHAFKPCCAMTGKIPWRRKWHPTPGFLLGESHGQRSLAGCRPQGQATDSVPGRGTKIPPASGQLNLRAATRESVRGNGRSCMPQLKPDTAKYTSKKNWRGKLFIEFYQIFTTRVAFLHS